MEHVLIVVRDGAVAFYADEGAQVFVVDLDSRKPGAAPVRLPDTDRFHGWAAAAELTEDEDISFRDEVVPSQRDALFDCILELENLARLHESNGDLQNALRRAKRSYEVAL